MFTTEAGANDVGQQQQQNGYLTLSFYRFVRLPPPEATAKAEQAALEAEAEQIAAGRRAARLESLRQELLADWREVGVVGRVYVAEEGVNAQLSVPAHRLAEFRATLARRPAVFGDAQELYLNFTGDGRPTAQAAFRKLRVKVRSQIVSAQDELSFPALLRPNDRDDELAEGCGHDKEEEDDEGDVNATSGASAAGGKAGRHLTVDEWHAQMQSPDAVIVDVRNHYESEVGRFEGALTPNVSTYKESFSLIREMLRGKEDKPVLMYCTGGIRCEKMSLFLHEHGFSNVNQLKGGIVTYAREVKERGLESRFKGKNFCFDDRLGEPVTEDMLSVCHQCGSPCNDHTNCRNDACSHLFIQCPSCRETHKGTCGSEECAHTTVMTEDELRHYLKHKGASSFKERVQRRLPFAFSFPKQKA